MTTTTIHRLLSVLILICSVVALFLIGKNAIVPVLFALCVLSALMVMVEFVERSRRRTTESTRQ